VNRTRVWLVVSPVVAAGVLIAHSVAYRLTSTPTDPFHAYLGHAPQVLLLIAIAGIVVAALGRPRSAPPAHVFPVIALATFVVQEHVERVVHGGVPMLLTAPAFLVGLVLQVPVALVAWGLARWILRAVREQHGPARLRSRLEFRLVDFLRGPRRRARCSEPVVQAPPAPLLSR
jgi:hypothetical protein